MSLISGFTNQTATIRAKLPGGDGYGGDNYGDPYEAPVRKERRQTWVAGPDGVQVKSTTYVLTEEILNVGDEVDGERVVAVEDIRPADGTLIGTECYL